MAVVKVPWIAHLILSGQSRFLAFVPTVTTRTQIVPTLELFKMDFNCTTRYSLETPEKKCILPII